MRVSEDSFFGLSRFSFPLAVKMVVFLSVCLLLLNSCLMHEYKITALEDGRVSYEYTASGDSADLYDGLNSLPDTVMWEVEEGTDIDTSGDSPDTSYFYRAWRHFRPSKRRPLPESFGVDYVDYAQLDLRHPLKAQRQELFFMVNYILDFRFESRRKAELYGDPFDYIPEEVRALEEAESLDDSTKERLEGEFRDGYVRWGIQVFQSRFLSSVRKSLEMHPEIEISVETLSSAEAALVEFLHIAMDNVRVEEAEDVCDLWNTVQDSGYGIIEEQLNFLGDTTFFLDMRSVGRMLAREYDITKDLGDDGFKVEVSLPGVIRSSNADSMVVDSTGTGEVRRWLVWEFNGETLADSTVTLAAISTIYRPFRIGGAAVILVIVLGWIIYRMVRKQKSYK